MGNPWKFQSYDEHTYFCDDLNNQCLFGNQGLITSEDSQIPCYVIATNEELVIAEDTLHLANIKN